MEATVEQFNFNVKYREASKSTGIHHRLEAFLNCWPEFLRNVTTNNG
ncbi:Uncharacterised protein [Vibrio cholerae]|nr:Uncharacterised protein [Vibrio cholerae]